MTCSSDIRLRLFTLAEELGNVSAACRAMGVDRSTYYRLKQRVDRWGLEALNVRERRRPRMPNQIGPHLEGRIIAFALGHPGYGPRRISAELAREKWGGLRISEHGVWRVLRRVGLNTRAKRLALIARHRDPYERKPDLPPPERHIDAREPGEKVQLDCFYVGRLSGTKGTVWQYTAIDVASAYTWAELHTSRAQPAFAPHPRARAPRRARARCSRLEARGGHHRQRLGVPRPRLRSRRHTRSERANASSAPADPTATAASSASSSRSSRSAGAPPSRARWSRRRPRWPTTCAITFTTTTPTAPTPGASPKDACPQTSSTARARPAP